MRKERKMLKRSENMSSQVLIVEERVQKVEFGPKYVHDSSLCVSKFVAAFKSEF